MSRNSHCNNPGTRAMPHIQNDARLEILLFLGIVFWCLLLGTFFQGRFSLEQDDFLSLHWNGRALVMVPENYTFSGHGDRFRPTPAALTPFLFQPMPVNFADPELLATLSGIGPELAARIVKTRKTRGHFAGTQDLLTVPGIGRSRMNQFAPYFSFSVTQ